MQLTQQEQDTLRAFADSSGISYLQAIGEEKITQDLILNHLTEIPKGFNPRTEGSLELKGLTSIPEGFNPTVGWDLALSRLTSIPEGFNPTVGGHLFLSRLTSIPEGFNPKVEGHLDLPSLTSIPEGFNPKVGGHILLESLTSIPKDFHPTTEKGLYLNSLTSIQGDFHPIVGNDLNLSSITSIQGDFHPTVGWNLDLSSLKSLPKSFNPTVGEKIDLLSLTSIQGATIPDCRIRTRALAEGEHEAANGRYLCANSMLKRIVSKHGNVYKLRTKNSFFYCITDGEGTYAHGFTLKEAYSDLQYKLAKRAGKEQWKTLDPNEQLPLEQTFIYYRLITGAYKGGIEDLIKSRQLSKESYSVKEIITLTKGAYGHEAFKAFFQAA